MIVNCPFEIGEIVMVAGKPREISGVNITVRDDGSVRTWRLIFRGGEAYSVRAWEVGKVKSTTINEGEQ